MTPPKTAPKGAAAKAAKAETEEQPIVLEWRGLNLQLPPALPGVFLIDFHEMQHDENGAIPSLLDMISDLLRTEDDDPSERRSRQFRGVRAKLAQDGDKAEDILPTLMGLVDEIFGKYQVDEGEADASPSS